MEKFIGRIGAIIGSIGGFGFTFARSVSEFFGFIGVPKQIGDAIVTIAASSPALVGPALLFIGAGCLSYLIADSFGIKLSIRKSLEKTANNFVDTQLEKPILIIKETINQHENEKNKEIIGLEKIYEEFESNNGALELRLRFLPDTDSQVADCISAICYLYKIIKGNSEIRCAYVDHQVRNLLARAPNARSNQNNLYLYIQFPMMFDNSDLGSPAIKSGYVERVGLATGGLYRLTERGENRAKIVVNDMIRRA